MNTGNNQAGMPRDNSVAGNTGKAKRVNSRWLKGVAVLGFAAGLMVVAALTLNGCMAYGAQTSVGFEASYSSDEYPVLDQYGEWAEIWPYGQVWRPHVVADWQPFCYGDWIWSQDGWTWSSYEPFGWVVYHYGEWNFDADIGWYWISGNSWSPARVDWVTFGDYICWAPMPAPGVTWQEPWEDRENRIWNRVEVQNFTKENVGHYRIRSENLASTPERVQMRVAYKEPARKVIQERAQIQVERMNLPRENVMVGPHKLRRVRMPEMAQQRIERNRPMVEREVLRNEHLRPVPSMAAQPKIMGHSDSHKDRSSSRKKP